MSVKWLGLFSLGGSFEELSDQCGLPFHISFCHALHLSLSDHVHDLEPLQRAPRRFEREKAHPWLRQTFDEPMILLDEIVEVLYLPQLDRFWKYSGGFELSNSLGIGRIFIHIDHARDLLGSMRRYGLSLITDALGLRG